MKIILLLSLFLFVQTKTKAHTILVGKGQAVLSIQAALLKAQSGDTIKVFPGTYQEGNLIINKPLVLLGVNYPVLDGESKYEIISVKSDGVTIDGFSILHSGNSSIEDMGGIKVYDSKQVVIRNNRLGDTFFGIYIQYGSKIMVENNTIVGYQTEEQQSGNGIHCWKSDGLTIRNNIIKGHRDGIYFEFVTNSLIQSNFSFKNIRYGLHFMFSHNDKYLKNHFVSNGAGVAVMFSHGVTMLQNEFTENWGDAAYGILLKEISDSYIAQNKFTKNTAGIYMEGASRVKMKNNQFLKNGWGLKIQASCMDIEVTNNNFIGNTFDVSTNGSVVLNTFNQNYWDKYEGYDLDKNRRGDVPYRPVSMYAMIVEKNPPAMLLYRSFITSIIDKTEKILPSLTPEDLKDNRPRMKKLNL